MASGQFSLRHGVATQFEILQQPNWRVASFSDVQNTAPVGGSGGGPNNVSCPTGFVLNTFYSGDYASSASRDLAGECIRVDGDGSLVGSRTTIEARKEGSTFDVTQNCPAGLAITGFYVSVSPNGYAGEVAIRCGSLTDSSVVQIVGSTAGKTASLCPAGFFATGITSRIGAVVDQAGLQCSRITIVSDSVNGLVEGAALPQDPVIRLRDAAGNITTGDSSTVVSVEVVGVDGAITGTTQMRVTNGVATFSGLVLTGQVTPASVANASATLYRLKFETDTFESAETSGIRLIHDVPAAITVEARPSSMTAGTSSAQAFGVALRDRFGNLVTDWSRPGASWTNSRQVALSYSTSNNVSPATITSATITQNLGDSGVDAGRATLSNAVIGAVATTSHPIRFVLTGTSVSLSSTVRITAGAADRVTTSGTVQVPSLVAAGAIFAPSPTARVLDAWGNATTAAATVSAVIYDAGQNATASFEVAAVNGIATFNNISTTLSPNANAVYSVRFKVAGFNTESDPQNFAVEPGGPASIGFVSAQNIASGQSGVALRNGAGNAIQLEVLDPYGNRASDSTTVVTATVTSGSNTVTSLNGRSARAVAGLVTFNNLTLNAIARAGYQITFTATNVGEVVNNKTAASQLFELQAGSAAQLDILTQSAQIRSNRVFGQLPVLRILDAEGSLVQSGPSSTLSATVTIGLISSSGTIPALSGTTTVQAVGGIIDFAGSGLTLDGLVGDYLLTYTITNPSGTVIKATDTITLEAGDVAGIKFVSSAPTRIQVGKSFTPVPVAELVDSRGNRVRADSVSKVRLELVNGATVVASTSEAVAANGVVTFANASFSAAVGTYNLRVKITEVEGNANATASGQVDTSASVPLIHGDPTKFEIIGNPATTSYVVGSVYPSFSIRVLDMFGNVTSTDSSVDVRVSVSPLGAPQFQRHSGALVTSDNGFATFSNYVMIARPGDYEVALRAEWMGNALTNASNTFSVTVVHAAPAQMSVVRSAADAKSRLAFGTQPAVEIRDAFGNLATSATGQVTISVSGVASASFSVSPSATIQGGYATFSNVALYGDVANYTLTYRYNPGNGGINTTQQLALQPGNPYSLGFKNSLAITTRAGSLMPTQPIARVFDQDGNLVTWDSQTVVTVGIATNNSNGALLQSDGLTPVTNINDLRATAVNGEASFASLRFKGSLAFSYSLEVSASGLVQAQSSEFRVTPGPVGLFQILSQPQGGINGENLGGSGQANYPQIRLKDSFGNEITADNNTVVSAEIHSGANGQLSGTTSAKANAGLVEFTGLKLSGLVSESYQLKFSAGNVFGVTSAVTLSPAAPSKLTVVSKLSNASAGVPFQPVELQVTDFSGNLITNASGVVSAVASGGGSVDLGTTALSSGTLTPNVTIGGRIGTYTVTYRVAYGSTVLSATHDVNLSYGSGTRLGIATQPSATGTQTGGAFTPQPVIELRDAYGNRVPLAGVTISAILHNPSTSNVVQKATSQVLQPAHCLLMSIRRWLHSQCQPQSPTTPVPLPSKT
ncbi:MAG: hypothetical protein EBS38_01820 [Actinobacteria bacterium]|nr:hypothetical protein [Actinomycetota bacterium]